MIIKLKNDETLIIKLKNQTFDKTMGIFDVTIQVSEEFLELDLKDDNFQITTEEKEF